jgi:hypothetical protein
VSVVRAAPVFVLSSFADSSCCFFAQELRFLTAGTLLGVAIFVPLSLVPQEQVIQQFLLHDLARPSRSLV